MHCLLQRNQMRLLNSF
uniref:Uncharacterized protein n=1 Tax=Rhizophora mucronata TaxID=61149 RepID=A0A2P2LQ33_RHIMU